MIELTGRSSQNFDFLCKKFPKKVRLEGNEGISSTMQDLFFAIRNKHEARIESLLQGAKILPEERGEAVYVAAEMGQWKTLMILLADGPIDEYYRCWAIARADEQNKQGIISMLIKHREGIVF